MTRLTKYVYVHIIQGNYGQGWEDLTAETKFLEARDRLREYNENEPNYAHRKIVRKILRTKYEKGDY